DFLSLHSLGETQNLNNLSRAVFAMARPIDIIFIADSIIIILLIFLFKKRYRSKTRNIKIFLVYLIIPIAYISILHFNSDFHDENYNGPVFFKTQFLPSSTMNNLSPIGYHFYDTLLFIQDNMHHVITAKEEIEVKNWLGFKNEDITNVKDKGLYKGKNLIFIQVESLENFVINQKSEGQTLTPNLNKMLANSMYFDNFYEQVNTGNSGDADLMVNASVLPVRRGSTFFRFPNNSYNTLSDILKVENYYSSTLHASDGNIWNISKALKNFGFDQELDYRDFKNTEKFWMGLTDESFFSQISTMIDTVKKPFYYYTVTVSSHIPFVLPDNMKNLKLSKEFDSTHMGAYFQSVNYADEQIGKFVDELDKKNVLDNTILVIFGDHTGVHKYYGDEINNLKEYESWWDDNLKVPFIIYSKGSKGQLVNTVGGEVDVLPTIANLFGIDKEKYENTSMGRDLLNTNRNYAILNDGVVVGKETLTSAEINNVNQSFTIADLIIRTNYFNK
ncbi:MAG TPA: LTA synthase family protein, partial [Clostridiaceae bacterium]